MGETEPGRRLRGYADCIFEPRDNCVDAHGTRRCGDGVWGSGVDHGERCRGVAKCRHNDALVVGRKHMRGDTEARSSGDKRRVRRRRFDYDDGGHADAPYGATGSA